MPKVVDLTVEIGVLKVTCPGVWLCPDGYVALKVQALNTSYQTCLLPPVFPLMFKDVFYFRKRFKPTCAINNLICLLKDETIYCELIQCASESKYKVLSKYLGTLDDVLFPPDTCWSDGVDLLMRRCKDFPGILSPKVEISTKIRIDEAWQPPVITKNLENNSEDGCFDPKMNMMRSKPACHSVEYHRSKHVNQYPSDAQESAFRKESPFSSKYKRELSASLPNTEILNKRIELDESWNSNTPTSPKLVQRCCHGNKSANNSYFERTPVTSRQDVTGSASCESLTNRIELKSRHFIEDGPKICGRKAYRAKKSRPCDCEICRRYHELFHKNTSLCEPYRLQ